MMDYIDNEIKLFSEYMKVWADLKPYTFNRNRISLLDPYLFTQDIPSFEDYKNNKEYYQARPHYQACLISNDGHTYIQASDLNGRERPDSTYGGNWLYYYTFNTLKGCIYNISEIVFNKEVSKYNIYGLTSYNPFKYIDTSNK